MSWLADYFRRSFIRSNGTALPDRDALNFIGFTLTDNPTTKAIDIAGGGSLSTDNGAHPQEAFEEDAPGASSLPLGTAITLAAGKHIVVDVQAVSIKGGASGSRSFNERRQFLRSAAGSYTDGTQESLSGPSDIGSAPATTLTISRSGDQITVNGAGAAARWVGVIQTMQATAGVAPPAAPDLVSVSPTSGLESTAVGLTLTGTDFVSGCTVTVGGVNAPATFVNSTSVTCTTAASLAAGPHDVVITNPDTQSDTLAGAYTATSASFDPATLSLTGWWRADFAASPWPPTASAGTSAANGNLAEATNPPTIGTAVNLLDPADFDGTNDVLTGTATMADLFDTASGSIAVLFNADTAAAPGAGVYDDAPIFCDSTANIAIGFSTSGVRAGFYDSGGGWKETAHIACATGGWHLVQMKWDATTIYLRLDSGAWITVAAVNLFTLTGLIQLGKNYNTAHFDGRIADVLTADTTRPDADFDDLVVYADGRYALAL